MARITNAKRDSIVENELKLKFFDKINEQEKKVKILIQTMAEKQCSPSFKVTEEMGPYLNFRTSFTLYDSGNNSIETELQGDYLSSSIAINKNEWEVKVTTNKTLDAQIKKLRHIKDTEIEMSRKLRSVLYAYSNDKKLLEAVPEFAHYFEGKISSALVPIEQIKEVRDILKAKPTSVKESK